MELKLLAMVDHFPSLSDDPRFFCFVFDTLFGEGNKKRIGLNAR